VQHLYKKEHHVKVGTWFGNRKTHGIHDWNHEMFEDHPWLWRQRKMYSEAKQCSHFV